MKEPYRSQFAELIRHGAGTLDIHDAEVETKFTIEIEAPDGSLWLLTNNTDGRGDPREGDDRIVRITVEPA